MSTRAAFAAFALSGLLVTAGGAAGQAGHIYSAVPDSVDAGARYLVYLHGRIIEVEGRRPTSPQFGVYEYDEILKRFADHGFEVVSEARPADTQVRGYATKVSDQVHRLLAAGVPPAHVAVVGFSKGGMIAATASSLIQVPGVRYVIMAGCTRGLLAQEDLHLTGTVLSIHEASDDIGLSCAPLFDRSPDVDVKAEKLLHTGDRHGTFFRPRPEWLDPLFAWLDAEHPSASTGSGR